VAGRAFGQAWQLFAGAGLLLGACLLSSHWQPVPHYTSQASLASLHFWAALAPDLHLTTRPLRHLP
jgi:hypothetical protein